MSPMSTPGLPQAHSPEDPPRTLGEARGRLLSRTGRAVWRNLDELASTDEHGRVAKAEYPGLVARWEQVDRRSFLKLAGASLALGGLTACTRQPIEKIVPYVSPPEEIIPGKPLYFSSAFTLGGYALGTLVESHMGRPTKIEGNPHHPASLGATDALAQASILNLYDPDRPQAPLRRGRPTSWQAFTGDLDRALQEQSAKEGVGLRLLTGTVTSPTLGNQIRALLEKYPQAVWHQYEPIHRDAMRAGAQLAFGRHVEPVYDLTQADVIVSLDADFLVAPPAFARYARDFASRRDPGETLDRMNRMYAVECMPSVTGSAADHRARARAGDVETAARALARGLGVAVDGPDTVEGLETFLSSAAADLAGAGSRGLVVPGDQQPAAVHALAHAINDRLGAVGTTVRYIEPVEIEPTDQTASIAALAEAMHAGEVDVLVMLEVNPVFDAPADLGFAEALERVGDRIHLGFHNDETSSLCHWYIPATHDLEEWRDVRAFDGAVTIVQPLIQPLYGGSRSSIDILAALLGVAGTPAYDIVREYWQERGLGDDFETGWRRALHDGIVEGTESPEVSVSAAADAVPPPTPRTEGIEVAVRPDPSVYDGRFANNAWLMEMPRPISKITWENAALLSPATGRALGVKNRLDDVSMVTIQIGETELHLPALMLPGHADDAVTLHLGYGRRFGGSVAGGSRDPRGVDVYPLRTTTAPWVVGAAEVRVRRTTVKLATTQHHPTVQESFETRGRHLVRVGTQEELRRHPDHPDFVHPLHVPDADMTLYPGYDYSRGNKWGMVIDLNTCIGCNACAVACQAENNVPTVGKEEVLKGREMHWIRLDRYWEGDEQNPAAYHQPLPCMHCENAPCETVCPVAATVHSAEGLNQMVYNRCVGTRYCSNNCPYKVRRFNFFKYADHDSDHAKLGRNPDVTVRSRGVMEKCSYCVQRINVARIEAKKDDNRPIRDGEVVSACQQACPVGAIAFGNLNDPGSRVAQQADNPRNYALLAELNVLPRTTYLAKLINPNPDLGHPAVGGAPAGPATESATGSAHP